MDQSIETPPGLDAKPSVIVRISGAADEEIIIVGNVVPDVSLPAQNQPLPISSPAPTEPESTGSVCEAIDCVDFDSDAIVDPDDIPYQLQKVDSDDAFPKSFGSDMIKRSKARRKKVKARTGFQTSGPTAEPGWDDGTTFSITSPSLRATWWRM